ncbi:hypothetical protein E2C01_053833 [Portunus trituberculatus]|uniref:Uncharacterized protein n=1 Tax=Portunus trituberculatus TaxID=210409 RepID=A0A5B7GR44_PORTR|nr:hypothetical protein [Portunus trituberculatus]
MDLFLHVELLMPHCDQLESFGRDPKLMQVSCAQPQKSKVTYTFSYWGQGAHWHFRCGQIVEGGGPALQEMDSARDTSCENTSDSGPPSASHSASSGPVSLIMPLWIA